MNILFSPIGMTDPISNFHDGALLHICRFYHIDKVYMFMSKEICELSDKDHRYEKTLEKLSGHIGRKIDCEIIKREDLDKVYLFDDFLEEFPPIIDDIQKKYPDATIYLNVSSGTPAMKSALQIISTYNNYIPVQVTTPERKSNPHVEDKKNYDIEGQWEADEDNEENPVNRCEESSNINLVAKMKKQMLVSLIENYDYSGARILAETMTDILSENTINMIKGAEERIKVSKSADKILSSAGLKNIVEKDTEIEYLLMLDVKVKRCEYADFLRGITPLTTILFQKILKEQCGFDIEKYVTNDENYGDKWNVDKLQEHEKAYSILGNEVDGKNIFTSQTSKLIQGLSQDENLKKVCKKLRDTEIQRNTLAHQITSISANKIKSQLGFSAEDIIETLYEACTYCGFDLKNKKNLFKSYETMNIYIVQSIDLKQ